jgi:uncharacterized OB-fold protein
VAKEIEYRDAAVSWETRPFWEGCARGELVLQRCRDCGAVQHRPRAICASCLSSGIEHFVASGRATVHSYTVVWQNQIPPFASVTPYVVAEVELDEGPRLLTNLVGCAPGEVAIGMPVRAEFVRTGEFAVPRFRPAA